MRFGGLLLSVCLECIRGTSRSFDKCFQSNSGKLGRLDGCRRSSSKISTYLPTFSAYFCDIFPGCLGRDVPAGIPYFTSSEGRAYKAQVGNSVVLECQVENLGKFPKNNLRNCFCVEKTALYHYYYCGYYTRLLPVLLHCESMRKYIIQIILV